VLPGLAVPQRQRPAQAGDHVLQRPPLLVQQPLVLERQQRLVGHAQQQPLVGRAGLEHALDHQQRPHR
jgi:hypothetical protein